MRIIRSYGNMTQAISFRRRAFSETGLVKKTARSPFSSNLGIAAFIIGGLASPDTVHATLFRLPLKRVREIRAIMPPSVLLDEMFANIIGIKEKRYDRRQTALDTIAAAERLRSGTLTPNEISKKLLALKPAAAATMVDSLAVDVAARTLALLGKERPAEILGQDILSLEKTAEIAAHPDFPIGLYANTVVSKSFPVKKAAFSFNYEKTHKEKIEASMRHQGMDTDLLTLICADDNLGPDKLIEMIGNERLDSYKVMEAMSRQVFIKGKTVAEDKIVEVSKEKLAAACADEKAKIDRVAWILNHRNMPIDKEAFVLYCLHEKIAAWIIIQIIISNPGRVHRISLDKKMSTSKAIAIDYEIKQINPNLEFPIYNDLEIKRSDSPDAKVESTFPRRVLVEDTAHNEDVAAKKPRPKYPGRKLVKDADSTTPERVEPSPPRENVRKELKDQILESTEMAGHFAGSNPNWKNLPLDNLVKIYRHIIITNEGMKAYCSKIFLNWESFPTEMLADIYRNNNRKHKG